MRPAAYWGRLTTVVLGACALLWQVLPQRAVTPVVMARSGQSWQLPDLPRWQLPLSASALIAGAPMWGGAPVRTEQPDAVAPVDASWRLAGILRQGAERRLLVSFMDVAKPPALLRVGEQLPSGHRIVRIDERQVCIALGKRNYILGLEPLTVAP